MSGSCSGRSRTRWAGAGSDAVRLLLKIAYWLAVVAISLALVVALILWFESQDASEVESAGSVPAPALSRAA